MCSCHNYRASGGSQFLLKCSLSENQECLSFSRAVVNTVMDPKLPKIAGSLTD